MFRPQGLFASLHCPDVDTCKRSPCPYSHKPAAELPKPTSLVNALLPVARTKAAAQTLSTEPSASSDSTRPNSAQQVRVAGTMKRPAHTPSGYSPVNSTVSPEPPRKIQKVIPVTASGAPRLQTNPAQSKVAVSDRQKLLAAMYDQFRALYSSLLVLDPGLPARNALAQELEVYEKSTRSTYRNAMITAMASIKKRPPPDKISHPSVGTIAELADRAAKLSSLAQFKLKPEHLEPLLLSREDMLMWEYVVDVPSDVGGTRPHETGNAAKCERCNSQYVVSKSPSKDECVYHWGRAYASKVNGVRESIHRCCSMPAGSPGCQKGPHVFHEHLTASLHARYPFSASASTCTGEDGLGALDICAIDCEMVHTTAGMSVARVSCVDHKGEEVFDHLVRMSEGVDVVDLNTRFSGITSLDDAVLDLAHVRKAIGRYIGPNTIIVGHALENDLKTLRMVHHRVVDTVALYKHKAGPPYRRALRELAREYLGISIQTGDGTTGHSSLEDARATLDLVRCWVMEHPELLKRSVANVVTT